MNGGFNGGFDASSIIDAVSVSFTSGTAGSVLGFTFFADFAALLLLLNLLFRTLAFSSCCCSASFSMSSCGALSTEVVEVGIVIGDVRRIDGIYLKDMISGKKIDCEGRNSLL